MSGTKTYKQQTLHIKVIKQKDVWQDMEDQIYLEVTGFFREGWSMSPKEVPSDTMENFRVFDSSYLYIHE